jgi:peptidoglycan/LPS O-acetylase OafA/YrhL
VAVLFFVYNSSDLEPFFFSTGWKTHRWLCYFYVAYLMPIVLYWLFIRTENLFFKKVILKIGKCSYEIFLVQMMVFVFLPPIVNNFISSEMTRLCIIFIGEIGLSIILGILFQKYINPLFQKLQ